MKESCDIESFNTLYKNYKERYVRFASSYVFQKEVAEDIVVESLMYYWENRSSLEYLSNVPVYILTIIKHKCLNYLQRLRTREEIEAYLTNTGVWELNMKIATLEACDPEKLFSEEVQLIVNKTLASLPEQTRYIFIQSRFNNQSHKEIADKLGVSTKSIEYHISKTLKLLRIALKDYFPFMVIAYKILN